MFRSLLLAILVLPAIASAETPFLAPEQSSAFRGIRVLPPEKAPVNGRLFVVFAKKDPGSAPHSQQWFTPDPFYAMDFKSWPKHFEPTVGIPGPLESLKAGTYFVQAIVDRDQGGMNALTSPGNLYSKSVKIDFDPAKPPTLELKVDQTVVEKPFKETDRVKFFSLPSPLLTKFHGRPMSLRAGVVLPKDHDSTNPYPIVYEIPGFGGNHHMAFGAAARNSTDVAGAPMIHVMLDPACRLGHHVFADSANNGPVGTALVTEFIPALEAKFGGPRQPKNRLLTGHSSGGWSSLWLQITYPDFFGGTWSTAPDSVDFRDFQKVDIHKDANLFKNDKGDLRPLSRGKTPLLYKGFADMEAVFGRGGQLMSFEAVFSPRGKDGQPLQLWDRATGAIHHDVAETWKAYDIVRILESNWKTLGPKLAGKVHVYMGDEDTFYLDGATRLLKASLEKLGSDAVVEMFPGKNHGNLIDANLRKRIAAEMAKGRER